jgi:DNA-directed RNA polymerase subunit beta
VVYRERAGFEVRDVHYLTMVVCVLSKHRKVRNIGLISTLCVHAKVNEMGFIETPYRKVNKGKVDNKVEYLTAEEDERVIAQSNISLDDKGAFVDKKVKCRFQEDFPIVDAEAMRLATVQNMDVAPNQIVGVSASLIPFLENDDANRALMGSNMQRQAVPLMRCESPIVGTGIEARVAADSNVLINAERSGVVEYVDANEIRIRYDRTENERLVSFEDDVKIYKLTKFARTNQATSINLRPIVRKGDKVAKGQILWTIQHKTEN